MSIELVSPFPAESYPLVWDWLLEFPDRNIDDYGPHTREEFVADMHRRSEIEHTWGVRKDGALVGIIAFLPMTERLGWFHGICFTRSAWGRETTMTAVAQVVKELFESGIDKIVASFFADNPKIHTFLRDLGAVDEGILRRHTMRNGEPVDMQVVALFSGNNSCH